MFNVSNSQSVHKYLKLMRSAITWFCDINDDMGLHSVSDFYAMLQYSFTCVIVVSDGIVNFPE